MYMLNKEKKRHCNSYSGVNDVYVQYDQLPGTFYKQVNPCHT